MSSVADDALNASGSRLVVIAGSMFQSELLVLREALRRAQARRSRCIICSSLYSKRQLLSSSSNGVTVVDSPSASSSTADLVLDQLKDSEEATTVVIDSATELDGSEGRGAAYRTVRRLLKRLETLPKSCLFVGYQSRLSADASSSSKSAETVLAALLNAAPTATTLLTLHSPALVEGLARDFAVPATDIRVHGFLDSLTSRERGGPFERSATEDEDRIELQPLAAEKPAACVVEWFKKGGMRTSGQKGLSGIKREGDCLAVVPVYAVISQEKSYAPKAKTPEEEHKGGEAQGDAPLSFNLSLTDSQREARDRVELPFTPKDGRSLSIDYVPDEGDDMDYDDPDEDLEI